MRRIFITVLFSNIICCIAVAQQEVNWKILADVQWVSTYFPEYDAYFDMPKFGKKVKDLSGKQISIKGFYVPVDASGSMFALSAYPSQMCFFCNGAGMESVMEIIPKKGSTELKKVVTDKYIELKGKLKLNEKEADHLMYILEEAELVRIIK
ncbi:MAG: hypothetical protein LBQ60_08635 [Bacteroidales bacterium]|jgi:hypothetical protein|nr:hypothetical protein [Bacteroidales bacterium]